jgi:ATP/ADP translocase
MLFLVRHPLATSAICIVAALIAVGSVSNTVDKTVRHHGWALAALIGFMVYAIALFLVLASTKGRRRLGFHGERAYAAPLVLLAIALSPVLISIGTVFLGAGIWSLWMTFGVFCALIGIWYHLQRRTPTT